MINNSFFTGFLKMSTYETFIAIALLLVAIFVMVVLKNKKVSFSARMLIGLVLGLGIGVLIDLLFSNNANYKTVAVGEIGVWYSLVGSTFVRLIQLMAVPVVFLSIFFVILDFEGKNIKRFSGRTMLMLLGTTAISAVVGILVTRVFGLQDSNLSGAITDAKVQQIGNISSQSFPQFALNLVPNNILGSFSNNSAIVSIVIIGVLFAISAKFLVGKKKEHVVSLVNMLRGLKDLVSSVLINIIKIMPYAVIALVANTIISNGLASLVSMAEFIVALYVGVIIMMIIYIPILLLTGLNPVTFYKKAYPTLVFAFSSRSSVGTLPYTLDTLENKMGVSSRTANFVGSLSTTIGMNGCAGVFPAMLAIIVGGVVGIPLYFSFYLLVVIVVTLGSIGIAGVPGTATVAATVTLNGVGLGNYFDRIGAVFGIDPLIDMGRTMLNVCGGMVSAVVVDKWEGSLNVDKFNSKVVEE
ncbi:MAG: cation:dicarboxylase symporter family transporter [Tissierellia bacterium]|nr:cation:dicarboxylase symporter family transporter [Tissierellia bacterium]